MKSKLVLYLSLPICVGCLCVIQRDNSTIHFIRNTFRKLFLMLSLASSDVLCWYGSLRWLTLNTRGSILQCAAEPEPVGLAGWSPGRRHQSPLWTQRELTVSMVPAWPPSITPFTATPSLQSWKHKGCPDKKVESDCSSRWIMFFRWGVAHWSLSF